jgi:Ca-activated chloride channel family protein
MGTEGYAPVPVQTATGVIMQNEKVSIDEKLLTQIADETGGKYFRARDNASLSGIYKEIDRMEKSKFQVNVYTHYTEKFLPFVIAALAFLLLEWILRLTLFRKFP